MGEGGMKVVLPFRGEFGHIVQWHAPVVHAIEGDKVVYIEEGNEALYPSATQWVEVVRLHDDRRRDQYRKDPDMRVWDRTAPARFPGAEILKPDASWPQRRFIPQPHRKQGITADVVIAPRFRKYGSGKNWSYWSELARMLEAEGLDVFAGGAPDSSADVPCPKAWDYPRFLDATIEAMHSARLVIATEAGLGPLAVLCGRPLLIITHADGLVAPGPVVSETGRVMEPRYWPIRMERHHEANHTGSPIDVVKHAWDDPARVLEEALQRLEGQAHPIMED